MNRLGRFRTPLLLVGATVAIALAAGHPARAHDFWIEPSAFQPPVGDWITFSLRVGEPLRGASYPRTRAHLRRFDLIGPDGRTAVPGREGGTPAGVVHLNDAGSRIVAYESHASVAELDAAHFRTYLREEGLEAAARGGRSPDTVGRPVRDSFRRYAKALLQVGPVAGGGSPHTRALGLPLEIVPQTTPYALRPGDALSLRVLHDGRPLPGVLVAASSAEVGVGIVRARTDDDGSAMLRLNAGGAWLVSAVHLIPAGQDADVDWHSLWASLTFEVPHDAARPDAGG
jgi:uncharacterized GH25 family protein